MFKDKMKCERCKSKVKDSFDFCPYCGLDLRNPEEDMRNFGALGKNEFTQGAPLLGGGGLGITEKFINSLFNNLMKSLEGQLKDSNFQNGQPKGIKIKFEVPNSAKKEIQKKSAPKKTITQEQIKRMTGMPRVEAKSSVRRLSDKVIYELNASGIKSPEDIFVSKLESGYEVKAIGKNKVYVNSLPVDLPLKGLKITEAGLEVEFGLEQ